MADTVALGLRFYTEGATQAVAQQNAVAASSRAVEGQSVKTAAATKRMGAATAGASGGFRSLGMQLNQVAQVGGMTGNWMNALAVQLPDMLLGFGAIGIYAGIAAGAMIPLVSGLMGTKDGAEQAKEAMDDMADAVRGAIDAADNAQISNTELGESYGTLAKQAREALKAQRELAFDRAQGAVDSALGANTAGGFANLIGNFGDTGSRSAFQRGAIAARELTQEYNLTEAAILSIRDAMAQMDQATGLRDQVVAASELQTELLAAYGSISAMPPDVKAIYDALSAAVIEGGSLQNSMEDALDVAVALGGADIASGITVAANEAARLATNMRSAAYLQGPLTTQGGSSGLAEQYASYGKGRTQGEALVRDASSLYGGDGNVLRQFGVYDTPKGVGGGGGMSDADKQMQKDLREAERIFNDTRTAAEEYATEMANLDALLSKGHITQDTYNRAVKDLDAEFSETAAAAKSAADAVRGAFDGIFDDPAAALENLAKQLLQMLLYAQLAQALPSVFGAGGIIPLTGTRASGGSVSAGGLYQVNERGTELFVPSSNGSIVPAGSGGGANVSVHNYGSPDGVKVQRSKGPDGREMVRVIVKEEYGRGGFDQENRARYGNTPQKVQR